MANLFRIVRPKGHWKRTIRFCIFCAIAYLTICCGASRNVVSPEAGNPAWEIVKIDKGDEPAWIIHKRKIAGTNFLTYKIAGDIAVSPEACMASFKQDIYNLANGTSTDGDYDFSRYEIVAEAKDSLTTYVIHNEPFPLKDTEMSVRYLFFSNEDGSTEVRWKEAWENCPILPSKKLKRVETFRGSWYFSPTADDACKAVNSVEFDLGGMPLWLVEPMVLKFLKGGLEDIRERASR